MWVYEVEGRETDIGNGAISFTVSLRKASSNAVACLLCYGGIRDN